MTGETQNKPRGSVNSARTGYDRNRRGRGNFNRGDNRGGRGRGSDYRASNRRGNEGFVVSSEGRTEASAAYAPQRHYFNRDNNYHYSTNDHVARFDGNTLSDLNEFPDFNQCENNVGSSRNYKKTESRVYKNSTEVKSLNWNGREQSAHFSSRGINNVNSEHRGYNRTYSSEAPVTEDRVFEHSHSRPSRGSNTSAGQGRGNGRQYQKRTFDNPRRANMRQNNYVANTPGNFEEPRFPQLPSSDLMTLYAQSRFVCPPSMEGYECMPGDTSHDHEESNFYKVKVNDDTLDLTMRIIYQLEFYFSNFNLKTDSFLRDQMDQNGYVAFETILKFPRMMRLKTLKTDLVEAVNFSEKLECDSTIEMVRRVDSPEKWTNIGLFNECARVYNSYIFDDSFGHWYAKAEEYIKGFPLETQKSGYIPDMQMNFPVLPVAVDPKTGSVIPPFLVPYSAYMGWPAPMEFMGHPDMDMTPYPMIPLDESQIYSPVKQEGDLSAEQYDPSANEMFKEVVSGRAVEGEEISTNENASKHSSLHVSNQDVSTGASSSQNEGLKLAEAKKQLEAENFMANPKELRNFKVSSKPRPQPAKYDRHSSIPQKNVKVEAQRDVEKQVKLGLKAYEHEQNKKSTSIHGALSQNPEPAPNIFVADLTKLPDVPKNACTNLPTVVDGTRIVNDKKVIQEAYNKYKEGMPEPIMIERHQQNAGVNGVKGAAGNKGMRKDNKRPSGAKGKKAPAGPNARGPAR